MGGEANRVAVITGGAGAIGRAIGAELSIAGHAVVSLDLAGDPPVAVNVESALLLSQALVPGMAAGGFGRIDIDVPADDDAAVQVDVTDPDSAAAMCARVLDRWAAAASSSTTRASPGRPLPSLASERCSFSTGAAFDLSGGRTVY